MFNTLTPLNNESLTWQVNATQERQGVKKVRVGDNRSLFSYFFFLRLKEENEETQ